MATKKKKKTTTTTRTTTTAVAKRSGGGNRRLYPKDTPTNAAGIALRNVKIPKSTARTLPLDAESARVAQQHQETLEGKGAGEKYVRWNSSDPRIRYMQCGLVHPHCRLALQQVSPVENEIPGLPISAVSEYHDLIAYLRRFWHGEDAIFEWKAYDQMQPQLATGVVHFRSNPK